MFQIRTFRIPSSLPFRDKKVGTAEGLPFPNDHFDVVISLTALHHADVKKALREIFRVLKKDGKVAISIMKKSKVDLELFKNFKKIDGDKDWIFIKMP